jgi:hypothetical protein
MVAAVTLIQLKETHVLSIPLAGVVRRLSSVLDSALLTLLARIPASVLSLLKLKMYNLFMCEFFIT